MALEPTHGSTAAAPAIPHFRLQPSKGWLELKVGELWQYRELLYFLVWRDIKVRYKQTVLGAAWAVLQPILTMLVFSVFFGRLAKMPSEGVPYPIFVYAALVPWTFFSTGLTRGSDSLVGNANLVKKVYFPRLAMPITRVTAGLVDFVLAFLVLVVMMAHYHLMPTRNLVWLPIFVLLATATVLGVSFWLSALNVMFRDVQFIAPFLTQFLLFATPIAYPSSLLPKAWRGLYGINPMVSVVEGFRWTLLGTHLDLMPVLAVSSASALVLLLSGAFYFRRMERTFADVI
jgi:homopolymeric O-antigen transport system permease protein